MEALLYTWGFNLTLLYSVAQTVTALVIGRSFNWLFCPFGILLLLCFCFIFFLPLQHALDSSCVFPTPMGESTMSPKSPDSS